MGKFAGAIPIHKRSETIFREALGPDAVMTKRARLAWLTARRRAGEQMTKDEVNEAVRLLKESREVESKVQEKRAEFP